MGQKRGQLQEQVKIFQNIWTRLKEVGYQERTGALEIYPTTAKIAGRERRASSDIKVGGKTERAYQKDKLFLSELMETITVSVQKSTEDGSLFTYLY